MRPLLRALAKLVFAASLPAADNPPSNIASMIKQCEAKDRPDLGEKILAQWAKVLDKYPQTRVNWATACALGGNSVKKNVFGGAEFIDWFAKELGSKPEGKNIPTVVIPEGTPAIAIPKKDETPEDWKSAAEETAHMLKNAEKAFASVGEFTDYLEKEISELQRKLAEYGPGGDKHLLKSGKPHSFVSRLPKWEAQLEEYSKKLASVRESVAKSGEKFKTTAKDYETAKVTTVAFENKVQDSLVDVLSFILDIKDLKKQKVLLEKFQENLKNIDDKTAASVTADAGEFLASLWEKVVGYWNEIFTWAVGLTRSVDSLSSIVNIMGKEEAEASVTASTFDGADVFDLAEALDYWLQHNWEGQSDELYKAHCALTAPGMYKPSPMSKFENMEENAKEIYNELTRKNYKEALDKVIKFDPEKHDPDAESAVASVYDQVKKLSNEDQEDVICFALEHLLKDADPDATLEDIPNDILEEAYKGCKKQGIVASESMTCEDFFDCDPDDYYEYIDEMHLTKSYSSDKLFQMLKDKAEKEGIFLEDAEDFKYDDFFWDVYQAAEKGLS